MRVPDTILTVCLAFLLPVLLNGRQQGEGLAGEDNKTGASDSGAAQTIKIGLLIQDNNSVEARQASELAILNANRHDGYKGIKFELVVRSMEGPWGTGSKQAVSLVFDENVVAITGSHDGRNAHLVEQVAAKSRVVFVSDWSADPTLARAFVPWFFNSVSNGFQQADALIREIEENKKHDRIAVIHDDDYDSGSAMNCFLEKLKSRGAPEPLKLACDPDNVNDLMAKIKAGNIDCITLFVAPPALFKLIEKLRLGNLNQPVYCPVFQLDENKIPASDTKIYDNVIFVYPVNSLGKPWMTFSQQYQTKFGRYPGTVAACAYDGMSLLIKAIRSGGTDREKLQAALKSIKYEGVTGTVQFDDKGNRIGIPGLARIKNGIPVPLSR
jgi:branched-chain amino acid transport system substrate-binding protein